MKRRRRTGMGLTVFTVLLLFTVISYRKIGLEHKAAELNEQKAKLEQQINELENEKENIELYKQYVQSDEYIEDIARKRLGLIYPDEVVFEPNDDEY